MYEAYKSIASTDAIRALEKARMNYEGDKLPFTESMNMIQFEGVHEGLCLMHDELKYAYYLANDLEHRGMYDSAKDERQYHDAMLEAMRVVMRLRH